MEGKLIKLGLSEGYRLDDLNGNYIASTLNGKNKLLLRNCQAIENGYDLDELAHHNSLSYTWLEFNERDKALMSKYGIEGFKTGFQKALELLGDKKFSEFLDKEKELGISDIKTIERIQWYYKTYFDKSQQTEWDVEIERETVIRDFNGNVSVSADFKLDADGCLILRRI